MQHNLVMQKTQAGWVSITGKTTQGGRLIVDEKFGCATPCRVELPPGQAQAPRREEGVRGLRDDRGAGAGDRDLDRGSDVGAPVARARDHDRGRRAGDHRRRRLRRLPVEPEQEQPAERHQQRPADRQQRLAVHNGKYEAIGADVLYGIGAIVAATALYGLLEHGPDSTGVAEHRSITLAPLFGPGGDRAGVGGAVLMRASANDSGVGACGGDGDRRAVDRLRLA